MNGSDASRSWRLPSAVLWAGKIGSWVIVAGVLILSLLPARLMPPLGPGLAEHFVAYLALATAAALGYGRRLGYLPLLTMAAGLAVLFEIGQLLFPHRTFSMLDFLAGTVGAVLGVSVAHAIRRAVGHRPE